MGIITDTFNALFKGKKFNTEINQYKLKEQYEEALETRKRTSVAISALEDTKEDKNMKGASNGYAALDENGKIKTEQFGTVPQATKLLTPRRIGITTGDVISTGSTFDGTEENSNPLTIANNAVTTPKIIDEAVTSSKIATKGILAINLADNIVDNSKLYTMNGGTIKGALVTGNVKDLSFTEVKNAMNLNLVDNVSDLNKPISNATQSALNLKANMSNPTFSGTVTVNGNIVQNGSTYETHTEQVYTKKDEIILRDGALTGLADGVLVGLRAKKYDGLNDGFLGYDNNGFARVGDIGFTQRIATIEDTPLNNGFAYYDNTNKILKTIGLTPLDNNTDSNIQRIMKSENGLKTIFGTPVGAQKYFGDGSTVGAIKIKLPTRISNTMFSFEVDIYEAGISLATKLLLKGFNNSSGFGSSSTSIKNQRVTVLSNEGTYIPNVYFCTGATEDYILIGEIGDVRDYSHISISNITFRDNTSDWSKDWNISLVTSLETLLAINKVTVKPSLNSTLFNGLSSDKYVKILKDENNVKAIQGVPIGAQKNLVGTGARKIKLPTKLDNTVYSFELNMFSGTSILKLLIRGYNDSNGVGTSSSEQRATVITNSIGIIPNIYFCSGNAEDYILIGEITDNSTFNLSITNLNYKGIGDWSTGWDISLVTTLETLPNTNKVAVTPTLNSTHLNGLTSNDFIQTPSGRSIKLDTKDLNNYKKNQEYYCTNCINSPVSEDGTLKIMSLDDNYIVHIYTTINKVQYIRSCNNSVWGTWDRILNDKDYIKMQKYVKAMAIAL